VQHMVGAASNLPAGLLVDRYSRKGLMMAASLFWVGFPYLLMDSRPRTGCCSPA